MLVQGLTQNQTLHLVVMALDSFSLEQFQAEVYMFWLTFFSSQRL